MVCRITYFLLTISFLIHIFTKSGQNDQLVSSYKCYLQFDLKGQVGISGVEKDNHVETFPICKNWVS